MQLLQTSGRSKANSPIIAVSFTPLIHLLVRSHATFCVPGTRCQCFISWNCKMPGVEKDFIDILVQSPGFHDKETDLAWLEDFSKSQRLVLLTSYLEFLAWFKSNFLKKEGLHSTSCFTKHFYPHHLAESLQPPSTRYKLKLRTMELRAGLSQAWTQVFWF